MRKLFTAIFLLIGLSASAADYYWVGGSGNWSDISHWAAVSGGTVKYPVAPSSEDNVIFDENSFTAPGQTVSFKNNIIFCKTMDWSRVTNNPTLAGPRSVTLNIFGDLNLSPDMTVTFEGKFRFTGEIEDKNVEFAGNLIPGVVNFVGESNWSVNSNVMIDSMLEISRGSVNFNGNAITCRFFHINTNGQKNIDISNSTILVNGVYQDEYGYDGDGSISMLIEHGSLSMDATGSRIELTAPSANFVYLGVSDLSLNELAFTAGMGAVTMDSEYFDEAIDINSLTFVSSAQVQGSINAGILSLGAGGRYRFGAGRNYEFGDILASSDCVEGVIITSDNPGIPATFNVPAGTIDLNFITLRDIHGTGASTLNANNGVDLGNNTGWNFTNAISVDYYWIGGSGSWDDPQHWSLTSGGPSAGCVPSGKDNAFFDQNSFTGPNQSVALNNRSTFIRDLIWNGVTNGPEFTGLFDQRIVVTGSLELDPNMEHDIQGFYDFESAELGNTILTNGNIFNESITFSGVDASWTFLDDVEVYRRVYFNSGRIILDGNQLTTTRLNSYSGRDRFFDMSDSRIIMRESQYLGVEWTMNLENYEVDASNSTIEFTERASFNHDGYSNRGKPNYNIVIFSDQRGAVSSQDNNTPESETAVIINDLTMRGRGNFAGSTEIGILRLADGFSYIFDSNLDRKQVIGDIITQGSCENGTTQLLGSTPGERGNIQLSGNETLDRMYVADIEILGATLTNNNSIDGGNNRGMTFSELMSRTLYWVGDAGIWQDRSHWSLTSGGPGGECIPTAIDDVFIDENSFSQASQLIEGVPAQFAYTRNFTFVDNPYYPQLRMNYLLVNGSMTLDDSFLNNVGEYIFTSSDAESILVNNQDLNNLRMRGGGSYSFLDDVNFNNLIHNSGEVYFEDIVITCNTISTEGNRPKLMNLGDSQITIYESGGWGFYDRGFNLVVEPEDSEIIFTGDDAGAYSRNSINLNRVTFANPGGSGLIASRVLWDVADLDGVMNIASLRFSGDGQIIGNLVSDTLVGVSGKVYTFEANRDVDVSSYLQLRGNNCTPIELRSSINASRARINMPADGEVVVDFVQMKDIEASGGANFNAGSRSVDVGASNRGWIFEDAPDFIESGFLGTDLAICAGEPVELVAFSYSPNEEYLWSDGSMDSALLVNVPGEYFVEVQFESQCVLRDTINVLAEETVDPQLADSTFICAEEMAIVDVTVPAENATYLWQDGSTNPILEIVDEGKYKVDVEAFGCVTSDSTYVSFTADPGDFLPADRSLCTGDEFLLVPMLQGESYSWQDGDQDTSYNASSGGVYWLDLMKSGCLFRDSILIEEIDLPIIDLGNDTSLCEGNVLEINLEQGRNYEWMDGSTSGNYTISDGGTYALTVTNDEGCSNVDAINVNILVSPEVDLGEDLEICESSEALLLVPEGITEFVWDDGSEETERLVSEQGSYSLTVTENGCEGSDEIFVEFLELPDIDLGPQDTLACEGYELVIVPELVSAGELTWQDNSNEAFFEATIPGTVTATIFNGECYNSDSIAVNFKDCVFFDVYVPNVFSPNEDGYNDRFEIFFPEGLIIERFAIEVFDRWGNLVFRSEELDETWDGKFNADELKNGIYVYQISLSYIDEDGPGNEEIIGDIAIFR